MHAPGFPNLAATPGKESRFTRAYRIDPARSMLPTNPRPIAGVLEMLSNWDKVGEEFDLPYDVDPERLGVLGDLVRRNAVGLMKALNEGLRKKSDRLALGTVKEGDRVFLTPLEALTLRQEVRAHQPPCARQVWSLRPAGQSWR